MSQIADKNRDDRFIVCFGCSVRATLNGFRSDEPSGFTNSETAQWDSKVKQIISKMTKVKEWFRVKVNLL